MTNEVNKLTQSKEIIAYLAEKFPACFNVEGEAKPLKIGIFEDIATRLADDERVSKTRLRTALRHYTNSWRYLRAVKVGSQRVDLDGQAVAAIEQEHQDHAEQSLAESKERAAARAAEKRKQQKQQQPRKAQPRESGSGDNARKARAKKPAGKTSRAAAPTASSKALKQASRDARSAPSNLQQAELTQLQVGQQVQVKAGKAPMPGTVTEIDKDDVQVQLSNGLTMKVKASNVFVS